MAYTYQAARARLRQIDADWIDVDLSATPINDIFTQYAKVYITLTNPVLTGNQYLDMDLVRSRIPPSTKLVTIPQWLASIGNASLPTSAQEPQTTLIPARYADAWRAGYQIRAVQIGRHPDAELPPADKTDLLLTKGSLNFNQYWKYCMVTVNGLFHRIGGSNYGLYVLDGGKSRVVANDNQVGIMSFLNVGVLDYIPITADMIYKTSDQESYGEFAHIKLPYNPDGKTVLLVLGGYLHILDEAYTLVGQQSLKVNFRRIPYPERIFESSKIIDLSGLGLKPAEGNPNQYALSDLYSDRTIVNYLTMSQSFIVVVDTPSFYLRRHQLERAKEPGRYLWSSPDQYPLMAGLGQMYDYRIMPEYGQYVYSCKPALDKQYNFRTQPWEDTTSIDPTLNTVKPWRLSRAFLLEMGRYL